MVSRIVDVRHLHDYVLALTFDDGLRAELDFRDRIVGRNGVFKPLEDVGLFGQVRVEPEFGALVWPNDLDMCPETLHDEALAVASPASQA
jgi:hypothetical protein